MCKDLYREICQFAGTDYVVSWLIIGKMASLTVILKQKIIPVHCFIICSESLHITTH